VVQEKPAFQIPMRACDSPSITLRVIRQNNHRARHIFAVEMSIPNGAPSGMIQLDATGINAPTRTSAMSGRNNRALVLEQPGAKRKKRKPPTQLIAMRHCMGIVRPPTQARPFGCASSMSDHLP